MLVNAHDITGFKIAAQDGAFGRVGDLLFDNVTWTIRYFLVYTSRLRPDHKLLLSPVEVGIPDWKKNTLPVSLTKEQVRKSPALEQQEEVTTDYERRVVRHYQWPMYWEWMGGGMGGGISGLTYTPSVPPEKAPPPFKEKQVLHSTEELRGFRVQATDGPIGHIEDIRLDTNRWMVSHMIGHTQWRGGNKVLVPPRWAEWVDWEKHRVYMNLSREEIQQSPHFNPAADAASTVS